MSCKYNLVFLILCGFAAPSVSAQECGKNQLEGKSCTIEVPKNKENPEDIRWAFTPSGGTIVNWRNNEKKKTPTGITILEDGSLRFESVHQSYTGTYTFEGYNGVGQQINSKHLEMKVYAKVPKPEVKRNCSTDGSVTLFCVAGNNKDLTITWYEDDNIMKEEKKTNLSLKSAKVKENKQYSCNVSNPVSSGRSAKTTPSCSGSSFPKLFGFDFWIMVGILGGGGLLLLLLICVLIFCACRSCRQRKKHRLDEEEYRLRGFQDASSNGTNRSKQTARGQPAPPIPQEESMHCNPSPETPPRTQAQPKPQSRARPPPPPQDEDEEDPPPLPRPRNKQHRKKHQEPYLPME